MSSGWAELPEELLVQALETVRRSTQGGGQGFATVRLVSGGWKAASWRAGDAAGARMEDLQRGSRHAGAALQALAPANVR